MFYLRLPIENSLIQFVIMRKIILLTIVMIASFGANAQKVKFKVDGLKDTTVFLAKYLGPKLYYADTAYSSKGIVEFDGNKHPRGLYAVILPGTKYFEFIIDGETLGIVFKDDEDGDICYHVQMTILSEDIS